MVKHELDAIELIGELLDIHVLSEMTLVDCSARGIDQHIEPVILKLNQPIPYRAREIVKFRRHLNEEAASLESALLWPAAPILK